MGPLPARGDSSDAIVMDESPADEDIQQACQSKIPVVSVRPPDSSAEAQLTIIQSEGELCDSCSSLGRPSSSFQLYHQVPQRLQAGDCDSPQLPKCPHCRHLGQVRRCRCHSCHSTGPCAGGGSTAKGSAHQASCQGAVRYHWLKGSNKDRTQNLKQRHVVTVRDRGLYCFVKKYSQVVVEYPLTVLLGWALVLLGLSLAGLFIGPLPDFSDPLLGFEPRGTYLGVRLLSLAKLQENTGPGKTLSLFPRHLSKRRADVPRRGRNDSQVTSRRRAKRMLAAGPSMDTFLCDAPGERFAQLVFRSETSASLWSLKAIHTMCEMEQSRIRSQAKFQELCQQYEGVEGEGTSRSGCCPSWSLGNYLAVLANASCCLSLTSQQVSWSLNLLRKCAPYYHRGDLVEACVERPKRGSCSSVPPRCKQSRAVFQILHFLVDKDFLGPQTVEYQIPTLKYSLLFLPVDKGEHMMEIYMNSLEGRDLTYNNTTITGIDFGIKKTLFKYYLVRDSVYPVLAVLSILFTMVLYLHSFFIVAVSILAITASLLTSYFFYKVVFRLTFFPTVNVSAALILLGSCSNHVFVFSDFWNLQLMQNPSASLEKRVNRALQEMGYLILASGLTSSAAFFSGYLSSITAIRCFSVYLGNSSLTGSLLALAWLPCLFVLRERHGGSPSALVQAGKPRCSKNASGFCGTSSRKRCIFSITRKMTEMKQALFDMSNVLFLKIVPRGVVKFRYIWVCWFVALAAGGTYMSCVDPGMKLAALDGGAVQLFRSSHPFERYDAEYRHMFMFERQSSGEDKPLTLTLVWGVKPTDNGDHFNPNSNGSLVFDSDFNMSRPEAQVWLRDLCRRVQNQSFYYPPSPESEDDNICLVEQLVSQISVQRCSENDNALRFCCDIPFPYPPAVFERCLGVMLAEKYAEGQTANSGGVYFQADGRIAALVLTFKTTYLYSFNFSRTDVFYREFLSWFNTEMSGAPHGLESGWFVSQLSLFDLQQSLSSETLVVAGFSVALTFVLFLSTTWNILLSIYATVAVGGSVFVTVSLLVLLEWQLSCIEALFISSAAGLSVDFVANYCVSYSLAPHSDRIGKVVHATKKMGCPVAIVSGVFFFTGLLMLPATALHFRKTGIFLFLVKYVACGFATFFFQSLCCFFGPRENCGTIALPCLSVRTDAFSEPSPASSANGAFGRSRGGRRSHDKEAGGYPNHQPHHRQRQAGGAGAEQYELQPLAYRLSDSFENSTCTSKLSNRPSVLSDEIVFSADVEKTDMSRESDEMGQQPPAVQTSSPYRENALHSAALLHTDPSTGQLLCKTCTVQSVGVKKWSASSSSSSLEETTISHTMETTDQPSVCKDESQSPHKEPLSFQAQSSCEGPEGSCEGPEGSCEGPEGSCEGPEVSCEGPEDSCGGPEDSCEGPEGSSEGPEDSCKTCLSDVEAEPSNLQLQPGRLNGKRDTLKLSLKETVYEVSAGRNEEAVILPNSQPDLPDVWIKRDKQGEGV